MTDLVGQEIGHYHVRALLGRGGLGTVYRAFDPIFKREVALKVWSPEVSGQPGFADRLRRWGRRVAGLEHPHILPIYDFAFTPDLAYVVMALAHGSLASVLADGPLSEREAARLLTQVGEALEYAHAQGVIHGRLTPRNILYNRTLNWWVSDFDLAHLIDAPAAVTHTGLAAPSPAYMAPEQAHGEAPIPETDVYALGTVAFEIVTGHLPFQADSPMQMVLKHIVEPPPDPRLFNARLSPAASAALLKALAKQSGDRPASPTDLTAALSRALEGITQIVKGVAAPPPPAISQERVLEAALKRQVPIHQPTELVVLIRRLEAPGLEAVLADDTSYAPSGEDVRGRSVSVDFPMDAHARPQPAEVLLRVNAPDFTPPTQEKRLRLAPDRDAGPFEFLLTPQRTGDLLVTVEVFQDGLFLGNGRLHTTGEPVETPVAGEARQVVALPLVVNVYQQLGGVSIQAGGDVAIEGDVVGRDKATATIGGVNSGQDKPTAIGMGGSAVTGGGAGPSGTLKPIPANNDHLDQQAPSGCAKSLLRWFVGVFLALAVLATLAVLGAGLSLWLR